MRTDRNAVIFISEITAEMGRKLDVFFKLGINVAINKSSHLNTLNSNKKLQSDKNTFFPLNKILRILKDTKIIRHLGT